MMAILGALAGAAPGACADPSRDWLVSAPPTPARVRVSPDGREVALENGLVRRTFRTSPNAATIELANLVTGAQVARAVRPEAVIELDGTRYAVGGLRGQPDHAFLDPEWLAGMTADPAAFGFTQHRVGRPEAPYPWQPVRGAPSVPWPPRGVALELEFAPPQGADKLLRDVRVSVHYELYDGLPCYAKWVEVRNGGASAVTVGGLDTEVLAVVETEKPRVHMQSDFAFAGMQTTHWLTDPEYTTQVDYELQSRVMLVSRYPLGPGVLVPPGGVWRSFRTFVMLFDGEDRERNGMARRRLYRTLAPQAMENPILMHVRSADSASVRAAIDQCAEVGFEMVIMTFWSGFDIENLDPAYVARVKADVEYAHSKGVQLGGYTLICASRDVGPADNCISPQTGKPGSKFGQSACLGSAWAAGYFDRVKRFIEATGLDVIETDGPYHGDVCASTEHPGHRGLADSQVAQWEACRSFYRWCRGRGVYINSPDWYYFSGSNKCAMGYRETNFSLPRRRQILISRQNIYDGTFEKTPSMGWMFVPLVEYHGGGAEATFEPLSQHLDDLEWHFAQNFGSGVQACYRGPRLYDTDATQAMVKRWVDFYRKRRVLLDSDIVHVRRADGRGLDCMLHVNPRLAESALAMVYNPTSAEVHGDLTLPLYYAGLTRRARVREREGRARVVPLDGASQARVAVRVPARGFTWLTFEAAR